MIDDLLAAPANEVALIRLGRFRLSARSNRKGTRNSHGRGRRLNNPRDARGSLPGARGWRLFL